MAKTGWRPRPPILPENDVDSCGVSSISKWLEYIVTDSRATGEGIR